jgi:hypothetical protein
VRRADHNISVAVEVVEAGGSLASAGMASGAGCGAGNDPAVAAPRTVLTLTSLCRRPTMLSVSRGRSAAAAADGNSGRPALTGAALPGREAPPPRPCPTAQPAKPPRDGPYTGRRTKCPDRRGSAPMRSPQRGNGSGPGRCGPTGNHHRTAWRPGLNRPAGGRDVDSTICTGLSCVKELAGSRRCGCCAGPRRCQAESA